VAPHKKNAAFPARASSCPIFFIFLPRRRISRVSINTPSSPLW
jgi:hypothetical protein